jgi:putative transposase
MVMPSRNVLKVDIENSYYHVYARGVARQRIFGDDDDYTYFLQLFSRYLSRDIQHDTTGRAYAQLTGELEINTYCLMPNHFHLLIYQVREGAITRLMRGVMTSYSRYFNTKYKRSGPLFETRYKASRISKQEYLLHISRYIHLNHKSWRTWSWSSYLYYSRESSPEWLVTKRILDLFPTRYHYTEFLADYEDVQRSRDRIKHELADSTK